MKEEVEQKEAVMGEGQEPKKVETGEIMSVPVEVGGQKVGDFIIPCVNCKYREDAKKNAERFQKIRELLDG